MIITQLSVFIENTSGRLYEVLDILNEAKINISALTIADTSDYGIIRLIVNDTEGALDRLKARSFSVQKTPVIACRVPDASGGLKDMLNCLVAKNISIEYLYAFSISEEAAVILKTEDCKMASSVLLENGIKLITHSEIN